MVVKGQSRLDVRKYYFSQCTVSEWNKLPADRVYYSSINMVKRTEQTMVCLKGRLHLDSYMWTPNKPY